MNASSIEPGAILAKVRPRQILRLLEILHSATVRRRSFVMARFEEQATDFSETVQLLMDIGWLCAEGDDLVLAAGAAGDVLTAAPTQRTRLLAETMFDRLGPYEADFASYLRRFDWQEGALVHHAVGEMRLRESPVRDFLMELGAVSHSPATDAYILGEPFRFLHLWARNRLGPTDQAQLVQRAEERTELGRRAELAVLEWERARVGPVFAHRVRHIAAESPAACFDLQSVTLMASGPTLRFIEVKAVSVDTYQFHWTAGEVEAARMLADRYFLYLLPVGTAGIFALDKLEIIPNPYAVIYQNSTAWLKEESVIVCRKRNTLPL
jgi:hypothetical protein